MLHKPACGKCQIELRPKYNGVPVIEMTTRGPEAIWSADIWTCPDCGLEIVYGFSNDPIVRRGGNCDIELRATELGLSISRSPFASVLVSATGHTRTRLAFLNVRERDIYRSESDNKAAKE